METTLAAAPPAPQAAPQLSEAERQELLAREIAKTEKLAESKLEMAQWFLEQQKTDIARRRLEEIIELYPESDASGTARQMLKSLGKKKA
jgi:TolA-binding protein